MNQAQEAFDAGQFAEAQKNLATALEIEPLDKRAKALSGEISFKTRYQMAEDALSHDKFDEALRALNGAEQFAPDSNDITVLRETINKRKAKQFEKLIQDAKNSLKQGALVDAMQQLADAEKLYPHDQRVASLSKKILPLQREIKWKEVTQDFRDSPISETYLWKYSSSLMAVRDGTIKAMGEILSGWKIEGEDRPDKRTIVIKIKPSGLGALGTPCVGVLMLSETENGVVEMRSKFWAYPRQESTAAEHLHTLAWELSKCLTRKLGAPINSGSLPNHR
jgi:tetratricopeptide (TPR) repeat protein